MRNRLAEVFLGIPTDGVMFDDKIGFCDIDDPQDLSDCKERLGEFDNEVDVVGGTPPEDKSSKKGTCIVLKARFLFKSDSKRALLKNNELA